MARKKSKILDRLNEKYKLVILNDDTFEEKASLTGTLWYIIIGTMALSIVIITLTVLFIVSTPLKEYFSTDGSGVSRKQFARVYARADSLEKLAHANDVYLQNIKDVINGKAGASVAATGSSPKKETARNPDLKSSPGIEETQLRELVEAETRLDNERNNTFFNPLKGIVTEPFNLQQAHFAVDIAGKQKAPIRATLDGKVIFASFTSETGYVIAIQHANNFVSFYKHCSVLLKKVNSFVQTGEVIAGVGSTGEFSSGPHLHFELWHNGNPVNPKEYIDL